MKKYIKPAMELNSFTAFKSISSGLNDWLEKKNLETDVGITTYYLESM